MVNILQEILRISEESSATKSKQHGYCSQFMLLFEQYNETGNILDQLSVHHLRWLCSMFWNNGVTVNIFHNGMITPKLSTLIEIHDFLKWGLQIRRLISTDIEPSLQNMVCAKIGKINERSMNVQFVF